VYSTELRKIKLQLQWKHQFEFAGFYAAKENGYYKESGMDVSFIEYKENDNLVSKVINNEADFGLTYSSLIAEYLDNKPVKFVANYFKQSPLVLIAQKEIKSPSNLNGKNIMGVSENIDAITLKLMLKKFEIGLDEVNSIKTSFKVKDFINKKVDAMAVFTTNEIYELDKLGIKYNLFNPSVYGHEYYDLNLFTSNYFLDNNPALVDLFRNASNRGWKYALENKEEIVDVILEKYNTQNKTKEALLFEANQIEHLMLSKVHPIGNIDKNRVQLIANNFIESGYVENDKLDNLDEFIFQQNKLTLLEDELIFIKQNPIIKIGSGETFAPFIFKNSKGEISGFDRDIADIIENKTGFKIEFELGKWIDIQQRSLEGEFDILSPVVITKKRAKNYNFSAPYLSYTSIVIVNRSNPKQIFKKSDTENMRVSVQKDNQIFEVLAKSLPNVEIVYYDSLYDVLNAVVKNEVDFTILDESIFYITDNLGISDFLETSFVMGEKKDLHFGITKNKPLLLQIFNKALASISEYQKKDIKNKWFKVFDSKNINFTKEEKEYLYSKESITFCVAPHWYPFEKIENGKHVGMSADFLKLFEKEIKIPFHLVSTKDWTESLSSIRNNACDVLPLAMRTENREHYLNFTQAYLTVPLVIATKKDHPFIQSLELLKGKNIGITKEHAFNEILREKYPSINIVNVESVTDGLEQVENKKLFGFVDALPTISYEFQKALSRDLQISGRFDEKLELSVGIRKDDTLLLDIFEKLVSSIDNEKKQEILKKYIAIRYENGFDYIAMYKIVAIALFIIILILYWNRKIGERKKELEMLYNQLKNKDLKLQKANEELEILSSIDKLTNIYNRRKIDSYLIDEIQRSERSGDGFSLIMIDIDYFKKVNDDFGHQVGDIVLATVAKLIQDSIREIDILGRWGGEEFLIICPFTHDRGLVTEAERIRKNIEMYEFKKVGNKTVSLGITTFKKNDTPSVILKRVDTALYKAKENGRNKVTFE
jgi:polar amino acid transport system substrate-binding protein